jgi:hypothetical protein
LGLISLPAIEGGRDYENFYLFRNDSGLAHIDLHEHREVFARDPLRAQAAGTVSFLDEDGEPFVVPATLTTSWDKARALEHWLPTQAHWPELDWQ